MSSSAEAHHTRHLKLKNADFYWLKTLDFGGSSRKNALRANFNGSNVAALWCMVRKEEISFYGRYFISCRPKVSTTRVYNLIGMG